MKCGICCVHYPSPQIILCRHCAQWMQDYATVTKFHLVCCILSTTVDKHDRSNTSESLRGLQSTFGAGFITCMSGVDSAYQLKSANPSGASISASGTGSLTSTF